MIDLDKIKIEIENLNSLLKDVNLSIKEPNEQPSAKVKELIETSLLNFYDIYDLLSENLFNE